MDYDPNAMSVGMLKKFLNMYFDDINVAVKVPGGQVIQVTGAMMKSVGAHKPLVLELLTEKNLDCQRVEARQLDDTRRDFFQP